MTDLLFTFLKSFMTVESGMGFAGVVSLLGIFVAWLLGAVKFPTCC